MVIKKNQKQYRLFYKNKFLADGTMSEIAEKVNLALSTLHAHKSNKRSNSHLYEFIEIPDETEFALYRGDNFIDIGTKQELMEAYGITPQYWAFYSSPTAKTRAEKRKYNSNGMIIERIEDDDCEEIETAAHI